jgi:ATP-dependent RNA helicase DeaD
MITCQGRLPKAFARTLMARGYRRLTPVQRAILRIEAADADLLVSARTGSGKTVAFGLALARRLVGPDAGEAAGPRALVVVPTRELAMQVEGELRWLFEGTGVRIGCCTGGADLRAERDALAGGLDVVVGTPGRLCDHLRQGALVASGVAAVVLDEADQMLGADFRDEIGALVHALPERRQVLMFSATVGPEVEALAARFQSNTLRIELGRPEGDFRLQGVAVSPADRERAIVNLLRLHEAQAAIVFCGRRETVAQLTHRLSGRGFKVVALSGALSQRNRNAALAAMREGRARVCVATDLAARGVDLPGLDLVLHADLPMNAEALLHRSGRTGRAGRVGYAVLIVPRTQRRRATALAARAGIGIDWVAAPDRAAVLARDLERMLAEAGDGTPDIEELAAAAGLLSVHGAERIAAAYRRLWSAARPAPEVLRGGVPRRA